MLLLNKPVNKQTCNTTMQYRHLTIEVRNTYIDSNQTITVDQNKSRNTIFHIVYLCFPHSFKNANTIRKNSQVNF